VRSPVLVWEKRSPLRVVKVVITHTFVGANADAIAKRCCKADRLSYRAVVQNKQDCPEDRGH
jgi:hypothetical protein